MNYLKFLPVVKSIAELSKDPSTKVGAVVVADDGTILSTGFNGFPRGVRDLENRLNVREVKYDLVAHAEANCVCNAARTGAKLAGATLIVYPLYPCIDCAKLIAQAGIIRVYVPAVRDKWFNEHTPVIFREVPIEVIEYQND